MSEEMLITYCAPTLAGLKAANLFSYRFKDRNMLNRQVRDINRKLAPKGVCLIPIYVDGERVLMYLYRPGMLKEAISSEKSRSILEKEGYPEGGNGKRLACLAQRIKDSDSFPHEIGLFLGYPPEDVEGFMTLGSSNAIASGFWKVYHNADQAEQTFERFRRCNKAYSDQYKKGRTLEELTVAI